MCQYVQPSSALKSYIKFHLLSDLSPNSPHLQWAWFLLCFLLTFLAWTPWGDLAFFRCVSSLPNFISSIVRQVPYFYFLEVFSKS